MNPIGIPTGAVVDSERERLLSVLSLAFDGAHYSPSCGCEHCTATREHTAPDDLDFLNNVSELTKNGNGRG